MEGVSGKKRSRDGFEEFDLPEMKKIREDLLGFLDDSDPDPAGQALDSVMKSFEEEISPACSLSVPVVDLTTSDSVDSHQEQELGYLLEASDDELGLPPTVATSCGEEVKSDETELVRVDSAESSGIGYLWGFEDQIPSYDSFGLGDLGNFNSDSEYVGFDDGLFEYSNVCFDSTEFSDLSWRMGTMPAE